ncbi:MAG TPA: hypothetical protein VNK04_16750 [Gemmataceae bacterium]|nr:hypothetical protein [Gemmataceae bacterium]
MIITRTPFRVSFAGGGSDIEEFYSQCGGAVLSTTIDKYMYIASHRFFDEDKVRVKYSKTETVTRLEDLEHPILREVLIRFQVRGALEISSNADIPAGSGLGSSSSFTVGLIHNLHVRAGKYVTKAQLAEEACDVEINRLQEPIGKQDQYAAAFGGLNVFHFHPSGTVGVEPIHLKADVYQGLQESLLMFHIGGQRMASYVLAEQKANLRSSPKREVLKRMVDFVWELRDALYDGKLERLGQILDRSWRLKQQLASKISNDTINRCYQLALENGALGGKLLGAGGSGFLLLFCPRPKQEGLRRALAPLRELRFRFEIEGSKVIFADGE